MLDRSHQTKETDAVFCLFYILQNPHMELSKYQTLPGKLSKKSELRAELNGDGEREYLSPVQLSPVHRHEQDYSLSEFPHRWSTA